MYGVGFFNSKPLGNDSPFSKVAKGISQEELPDIRKTANAFYSHNHSLHNYGVQATGKFQGASPDRGVINKSLDQN